jgi:hypothetical protein
MLFATRNTHSTSADYTQPEINCDELWEIWDLDEKWIRFTQRKERLHVLCRELDNRILQEMVDGCLTEEELTDFFEYFKIQVNAASTIREADKLQHVQEAGTTNTEDSKKLPTSRNPYIKFLQIPGIQEFCKVCCSSSARCRWRCD